MRRAADARLPDQSGGRALPGIGPQGLVEQCRADDPRLPRSRCPDRRYVRVGRHGGGAGALQWYATGDFLGVPPSGKRIDYESQEIYRFEDGKLAEEWISS